MKTVHRPVMLAECLKAMNLSDGTIAFDGTAGGGGHTVRIASAVASSGRVIAMDRDPSMIERARSTVELANGDIGDVVFQAGSYTNLRSVLNDLGIDYVDAILVDLGLSSDQLADRQRGFGFQAGGPLDLRFDTATGQPASEWLKQASDSQIADVLARFADLSPNSPVTEAVIRAKRNLNSTESLTSIVEQATARHGKTHPATVVLQALRIVVNDELSLVEYALTDVFPACLKPGGRLAVLSFHSVEDRIVKVSMQNKEIWTCPQKKPILPRPVEVRDNPRSRSAKLRVAIRNDER